MHASTGAHAFVVFFSGQDPIAGFVIALMDRAIHQVGRTPKMKRARFGKCIDCIDCPFRAHGPNDL